MRATLHEYARGGAAVLAITHDVPLLTATRGAVLMRNAKVIATGDLTELEALSDPYVRGFFQ